MKQNRFINNILNEVYGYYTKDILNETPDYEQLRKFTQQAVDKGISNEVGSLGPLKLEKGNVNIHDGKCHLVRLSDIYGELGPNWRNVCKKEFEPEMQRIHQNYKAAMETHYPNSRDLRHISDMALNRRYAFTDGDSYIFMFDKYNSGYWVVTHFSPSSNRNGYKLLKELVKYDNIIFAVTAHMWPQLAKMGLVYPETSQFLSFNGLSVEKMFFTTDKELLKMMLEKEIYKNGGVDMSRIIDFANGTGLYSITHGAKIAETVKRVINEYVYRK